MSTLIKICLFGLGVSFFCGYVIISVGLGSVWPALYKAAEPIICQEGQSLNVDITRHTWKPGSAMWTARITRVGPGHFKKEDVTSQAKLAAGSVYGLGLFLLFLPRMIRNTRRSTAGPAPGEDTK